jgi:carboxylesterase
MTVAGLSLGAILTGLLAHSRADIARAVLIAPGPFTAVMSHVADRLPNFYLWWDRSRKEQAAPPYGYPRFSTHAYAAQLHAGRRLVRAARRESPLSRSLVVITNADGPRLGNLLVRPWRDHGADVQTHELSVDEDMLPDLASIIEGVPANFA